MLEVCDLIRAAGRTWLDESVGILFAPDVFDEIPEAARRGVRPNALATLSELVAGSWSFEGREGGITDSSARLYQARGVETTTINRLGPRYPVLVGARNADVSYGSQNEIYRGMGRALSEWVASVQLQDSMNAYFSGNRQATAVAMIDRLGLKQRHHETPFSALGFARLSLGRDWFEKYASQYVARAAAERINSHHLKGRLHDDSRTDDELIAEQADQAWPAFLDASRLDERGVDANQVVDALRPLNRQAIAKAWIERVLLTIKKGEIPADGLPVQVWQDRIEKQLREQGPQLRDDLRSARLGQARRWVDAIQDSLLDHVIDSVATYGGAVTQQLMSRLSQELEIVVRELPEERGQQQQKSSRAASDIRAALSKDGKGRLAAGSAALEKAVGRAAASVGFDAEAELYLLVEELLRDLRTGLVEPLSRAVTHALETIRSDARRQAGHPSKIEFWPVGNQVPGRLHPAKNEFLLDEIQNFPRTMRDLLKLDTGKSVVGDAEIQVVQDVITGADARVSGVSDRLKAAVKDRTWVPAVPDLHESMASPAAAAFTVRLGADDLLQRAEDWIQSDQRNFGRHLEESLASHLSDPNVSPAVLATRLQRFAGQFKATIGRAQPLVHIDRELLSLVHDKSDAQTTFVIDQVPLPTGSDAAEKAREVLATSNAAIDAEFTDLAGQTISVFGVLTEPYEPTVFTSLMKPMVNEWAEVRLSDDSRQSFWTWRRSRTLPEFVPAAPAVRRAMMRGWFTALILGQMKGHAAANLGGVEVWSPGQTGGAGAWQPFPHPLLRSFQSPAEASSAVLESLPVALLDVFATRSLKPLGAYHRIRDLGAAGHNQGLESYETLNEELAAWVTSGGTRPGAPTPDERAGTAGDSRDVRRQKVVERLEALRQGYVGRFEDLTKRATLVSVPRDYELRHDILEALEDLIKAVEAAASRDDELFT